MIENGIPTEEELATTAARVKESMIFRFHQIYGESDEFEQWADALDLLDRHPNSEDAREHCRAALRQLQARK